MLLKCSKCSLYLDMKAFYNNKNKVHRYGKHDCCKSCELIRTKNKRIRKCNDSWEYFIKELYNSAKIKVKNRNMKFEITINDLKDLYLSQNGLCSLSQIKMTHIRNKGSVDYNISIDRIDSKLGYIKNNIQLVCTMINRMKRDMDQNYFIELCQKISGPGTKHTKTPGLPKVQGHLLAAPELQQNAMGNVR